MRYYVQINIISSCKKINLLSTIKMPVFIDFAKSLFDETVYSGELGLNFSSEIRKFLIDPAGSNMKAVSIF